jgi:hypothetical protein
MERKGPPGDAVVLQRPPHQPRRHDWAAVVAEADGSLVGELGHLRQLGTVLPARDRGEEADGHLGLGLCVLDQRPEHGGGVHDRLGVGHRQDRAVPTRRRSRGS